MTQTFADELFNNLSKLKGGYKLDEEKTITLECKPKDLPGSATLYFYGLDYSIGSGTNKGNFIIGEKVAETVISHLDSFGWSPSKALLIFDFINDIITSYIYIGGDYQKVITNDEYNKITSKVFYSVSNPYPALFITSANIDKNPTYNSNLNNAINEINTNILNEGVIYTVPEFVKEE